MLFGLPFFLVGIGFLVWSVIPTFYDGWRMASWPATAGQLTHAELAVNHSDDSTTYQAKARYTYEVSGRRYASDRVAINSGSDNIGDFQHRIGRHLEGIQRHGRPVNVFYNPADPQDSVLNREIRWGLLGFKLIFVCVFGGVGAGLVYWGFRGKKTLDIPDAQVRPWLARPEWQGGVIYSSAKSGMFFIWGFAAIWNLISLPAALQFMDIWQKDGWVALLVLLFPLVGLGLIYWAIRQTMQWKRFGVTPLHLDPFPGAIGGHVGGEIKVNLPYQQGLEARVTLSNVYSYVSGSGKNRSRRESIHWQDDGYAQVVPYAEGIGLRFRFDVPRGLRATEESANQYYFWRLNVEMELAGTDLNRSFEIPVYDTGEQSKSINIDSPAIMPASGVARTAESLLPISRQGNTRILYYGMLRKPLRSVLMLVFGSIFTAAGVFLWSAAVKEGAMLYLMSAVFSLVGGSIVVGAFYSAFNSLQVTLDGNHVTSVRKLLGFPIARHQFGYSDVLGIEGKQGMQSQSGNKHKVEYSVIARLPGKTITLAEHLDSASNKKLVIEYFSDEIMRPGPVFEI